MQLPVPITVALLGGVGTAIGYFISNRLERQKELRLREIEFRLERYREFLLAFIDEYSQGTFETQLHFVNCTNVILLIGSPALLLAIKELVVNFNDEKGTVEQQWEIMDRILLQMRHDLNSADSDGLKNFRFPLIVPDVARKQQGNLPQD
jgi:hypothetical protein